MVSAAAVGLLIGCALGQIEGWQREVISPYIAKAVTKTVRFLGLIDDDDASESKFQNGFEKILKLVLTAVLVVAAGALGGVAGYLLAGTATGIAVGATAALGAFAWKSLS